MNFERIWAIARKDWREVRRNRSAWLPMVIVPLIFVVVLPAGLLLAAARTWSTRRWPSTTPSWS